MEKICLVKLRKKIVNPILAQEGYGYISQGQGNAQAETRQFIAPSPDKSIISHEVAGNSGCNYESSKVPGETVSLTLTQEQVKTIRSCSSLQSVFSGELAGGLAELNYRSEPVTIKFEFEPLPLAPIRLLMSEEVEQMLRVSRAYLNTIVRDGKLKSYKVGRNRRYMLEDVLSYLEDSLNSIDPQQDALKAETISS